jgi:hypothetical protein
MARELQQHHPISLESSPYDVGWSDGYEDIMPDNPYKEGTPEYDEYCEGYIQGSMDC